VVLPPGLLVVGEILTGHVRSIDTMSRPIVSANWRVPASVLDDVRAKLAALLGING
jgi:mRNA interferase MazF